MYSLQELLTILTCGNLDLGFKQGSSGLKQVPYVFSLLLVKGRKVSSIKPPKKHFLSCILQSDVYPSGVFAQWQKKEN